jgi:hypothetical protein
MFALKSEQSFSVPEPELNVILQVHKVIVSPVVGIASTMKFNQAFTSETDQVRVIEEIVDPEVVIFPTVNGVPAFSASIVNNFQARVDLIPETQSILVFKAFRVVASSVSKACVKIVQFTSRLILSQATIVLFTVNCICSLTGTTLAISTVGDSVFVIFRFQRLNAVPAVTASIEIEFDVFVIFKTHEFDEAIREAKSDIVESFVPEKVTE